MHLLKLRLSLNKRLPALLVTEIHSSDTCIRILRVLGTLNIRDGPIGGHISTSCVREPKILDPEKSVHMTSAGTKHWAGVQSEPDVLNAHNNEAGHMRVFTTVTSSTERAVQPSKAEYLTP